MTLVRGVARPTLDRGESMPTLQRLVDRSAGSEAFTVLVNEFRGDQAVPVHVHDVEEVLLVRRGACTFTVDGHEVVACEGDAVVVAPGTWHGISHTGADPATVVAVLASPDIVIGADPGA